MSALGDDCIGGSFQLNVIAGNVAPLIRGREVARGQSPIREGIEASSGRDGWCRVVTSNHSKWWLPRSFFPCTCDPMVGLKK
jgi:hypothetical protein